MSKAAHRSACISARASGGRDAAVHWTPRKAASNCEWRGAFRILEEPRHSQLLAALRGVQWTAASRPPLARALMQADLWAAFDMLHALTRIASARQATGRVAPQPGQQQQQVQDRAETLLPTLAETMRALALSREEIARLPD